MARKKRRGVSLGTYVLTVLCLLTLFAGVILYSRISGDIDQISLNPKMLSEPFETIRHSIMDTQPDAPASAPAQQKPAENPLAAGESPVRTLSIGAVGQITIGNDTRRSARVNGGYDFGSIFQPVADALSGADLSLATLRTLVTDESSRYDAYFAPKELIDGMKANGFQLFNLATDRILDGGIQGIEKTRSILQSAQVATAGAYLSASERDALPIKEIAGCWVGVLSYTESLSSNGRRSANEETIQTSVRLFDVERARSDIAGLRRKGAEVIIVLAHWGGRSDARASREVREAADALVAAGADIILGTNPAQVHEIEKRTIYNADGSARDVFIAYSLGNFLVDDTRETAEITGMVLRLTLSYDRQTRRLSIQDAWYMPTWIMRWQDRSGQNRYRVVPAGASQPPPEMTNTVYGNMNRSYQNMVTKMDASAAWPRAE